MRSWSVELEKRCNVGLVFMWRVYIERNDEDCDGCNGIEDKIF
jgi:hypothetical protein